MGTKQYSLSITRPKAQVKCWMITEGAINLVFNVEDAVIALLCT
jgi:hypothetical protein